MEKVQALLERDPFALHLGIKGLVLKPGYAHAKMEVQPFLQNSFGMVHGGAIFSLADYVFQAASNSHGTLSVAIQANITFLSAPGSLTLFAEAREVSRSKRLATYSIRVTEGEDQLIALFQGTVYRKQAKNAGD